MGKYTFETIHGMHKTRLYRIWAGVKHRCTCPTSRNFKYYGGRGIGICNEWLNFVPFMKWAFANGYTDELTIDRIDNDKGYFPENCRWVSMKTQLNNRRDNVRVTYEGETHTLSEWAEIKGINRNTFFTRLQKMSFEEAINKSYEPKKKELVFFEGEYITKKELSERTGVNYSTIRNRLSHNKSFEEVINVNYRKLKNPVPLRYEYNGELLTLPQISKKCGVKYSTIVYRLNKGLSIIEAVSLPVGRKCQPQH